MTKSGYIKLFGVILIVAILVFVCVVEGLLASRALNSVKSFCHEIEIETEKQGGIVSDEAVRLVENLDAKWKKDEAKLCLLVNHKSIEQLGVEIVRLKAYIDGGEETEFFTSLEIIKNYAESYRHLMGANFHNVL